MDLPEDVIEYCLQFSNIHGYEMIRKRFGVDKSANGRYYYYGGFGLLDDLDRLERGLQQYSWRKKN